MNWAFNAGFTVREPILANREPFQFLQAFCGLEPLGGYLLVVWPFVSRHFEDSHRKSTIGGHALLRPRGG